MFIRIIRKFENNTVFTEDESWMLFKIAAFAEAIGWTLLILGIAIEKYLLPGNSFSVILAGRMHGLLFFLYLVSIVGLYPTLRWSRKKSLIALLASIPPYGTLFFEQWEQYIRNRTNFRYLINYFLYVSVRNESIDFI